MAHGPLEKYIEHKNFYGSMRYYVCGSVQDNSCILEGKTINFQSLKTSPLNEISIDLSTFEKRLLVKENSLVILKQLIDYENEMKRYLIDTVSIEDLIVEEGYLKKAPSVY